MTHSADTPGALLAAEDATDHHTAGCSTCRSGHACPQADDRYEGEYRAWATWVQFDPSSARRFERSRRPQ